MGFLSVLFALAFFWGVSVAQKCQIRTFRKIDGKFVCLQDQFCNITTKKCEKCDSCYDFWNDKIKIEENKLNNLLDEYEGDLFKLVELVDRLEISLQEREKDFGRLNSFENKIPKKIQKLIKRLNELKKDLQKVKDWLEMLHIIPIQEVEAELAKIKKDLLDIQGRLNKLKPDLDALDIDLIKKINRDLARMNKTFPSLERDSLNLAFSLESDLDFLEEILSGKVEQFNNDTHWIEASLADLFSLLAVSFDSTELNQTASKLKSDAERMEKLLDELLLKHQNYEDQFNQLKKELAFFQALQVLLANFEQKVQAEIAKYEQENLEFLEIAKKVEKYNDRLEKLLNEEDELLERYQRAGVKKVKDFFSDLNYLKENVTQIIANLKSNCVSDKTIHKKP